MIATALSILGPVLLGYIVIRLLIPRENGLIAALLSVGIGYGISSWLVFLWLMAAGHASRGFALMEWAVVLVGAGAIAALRRRPPSSNEQRRWWGLGPVQ